MKKTPLSKPKPDARSQSFLRKEGPALLALTVSLLFCFKDWIHFFSKIFLSLDSTVLYYPMTLWVHDHLLQGKLPLISDLLYNGAPVAATSMAGVLSPFLWVIHSIASGVLLVNLLFVLPFFFYLFGSYFLGRELSLSTSASTLLAFLWAYNGHQMAQLDHQNVAWAHAFFPWAFLCLLRYQTQKQPFWLLFASFLWGLCLFCGHPQVVFLEGLFFLIWALTYPRFTLKQRLQSFSGMTLGTLVFTAPLTLFTSTFLSGEKWSDLDRFFHSWTPLNFITLIFPWFFGKDQYDRVGSDYWWQYQFVEMQVAFSIAGLFFILLFFFLKKPERRWITATALFGLAMALGKFFLVYPLIQSLPFFSFFRDPARYWFLITWAAGLGAAYAWDDWFKNEALFRKGQALSLGLLAAAVSLVLFGWLLLAQGQILIQSAASWLIQHCLLGDSLHTQTLSAYLERLPEKLAAIAANLNPLNARVRGPFVFLACLTVAVFNRKKWDLSIQKPVLIALVFIDLMAFRMPLGNSFYSPSDIPNPQIPGAPNRSLPLISQTNSPLPAQYGQYAFPNTNLISRSPVLPFDANPSLSRYNTILADLGWFAWVYKDRDLLGFSHHPHLLSVLGVDRIISDTPFTLPLSFKNLQNQAPYVYGLTPVNPKTWVANRIITDTWPDSIGRLENKDFNPLLTVLLEPDSGSFPTPKGLTTLRLERWDETRVDLIVWSQNPALVVFQKTALPGWKARVNGQATPIERADLVLMALTVPAGENRVELTFEPLGLRLGFFLALIFLGLFTLAGGILLLA